MSKSQIKFAVLGILALAALVVTGCGGDSESQTTESLTKAQYVKQADAICKRQNEKKDAALNKAYEELQKEKTGAGRAGEEKIIEIALPPIAEMTEEVAELGVPTEQSEEAEKFVGEMEAAISEVQDDPSLALDEEPFEGAKARAARLGFKQCNNF
jgi:hypothetical protein